MFDILTNPNLPLLLPDALKQEKIKMPFAYQPVYRSLEPFDM